jgi:PAS domain S-box-containing protein
MMPELRKTGINVVGDMPWGTHFCHFYETKGDLLDTLVPYFKAGLESDDFCVWVISEPVTPEDAWDALRGAVPELDRYFSQRSIEIIQAREWYLHEGTFDRGRVAAAWNEKLTQALARGYPGMRVSGNTSWLDRNGWEDFAEYERHLNDSIGGQRMTVLCTYPLATNSAADLLDAARTHQFAIAKRRGKEVVETPQLKRARDEIRRLNEELEARVTERTQQLEAANAELRSSAAQLRLLAEAIPQQVWSHLPDGSVNYCNQRWLDYTGLTPEEAQRDGWAKYLHPADVEPTLKAWRESWSGGTPYTGELRLRGANGRYRRFLSRAVPIYDDRGHLLQWFGTNTDIEERKHAEEALHEAQAELAHVTRLATMGELAASLAHDLNQPLAAIVTNGGACLRWLDRDPPDIDEARHAVQRIIQDADLAGEVIAHTRALLRKSSGDRTPLDVTEIIRGVVLLVHPEVMRHHVAIDESLAQGLPPVLAARVELQQVVLNLIVNGIEAMANVSDRRRRLGIRSERHDLDGGPGVLVAVEDAGVGITMEQLDRLFEAFYTTKEHGLGMGLSIARSIIQAHGGRLWVSANPHHGATFQFVLPAASTPGS